MKHISLDSVLVVNNRVDYYFSSSNDLKKYFNHHHMFLEFNFDLKDVPDSILAIPFVANVIPLVWITNSTLYVNELDSSFLNCLDKIRAAYQEMFRNVNFKGEILAEKSINNTYTPQREAASLFSGGLDALTTFVRIKDKKPLLITEYGWHGEEITFNDVWEADKQNALDFAEENSLDNILIQSNYGTFINSKNIDRDFQKKLGDSWWHGLHHGLAIISSAIPMAYKFKVECIYIASSNSFNYHVPCASDPTVDNEITYSSGRVIHDGYELNRQNKIKIISDFYKDRRPRSIRVCFKNEENCCKCEKCLRTIMGLIAEGRDPRDFGFSLPSNISQFLKKSIDEEVKSFTDTFIIIYWDLIKKRMNENREEVLFQDILDWFCKYEFRKQRKLSLLNYRVRNFFPILSRKINSKIMTIFN
jgi:hypothetical protein